MHKLAGVHPELSEKILRILAAMEVLGQEDEPEEPEGEDPPANGGSEEP